MSESLWSDDDLLAKVSAGETEWYGVLVQRHQADLFRFAMSLLHHSADAEDAVQDAFLKAWEALPGYQPRGRFKSWLMQILYRTCLDQLRRGSRHPQADIEHVPEPADAETPLTKLLAREQMHCVSEGMKQLSAEEAALVYLRFEQNRSYADIAWMLHLPAGTVASKISRCRQKLKKILEGEACHDFF